MFRQVLAIDVAERVGEFSQRMRATSNATPLLVSSVEKLSDTHDNLENVDAIIISIHQDLPESFLQKLPNLSYVGVLGTSLKRIPLEYCRERQITVTNVTEYCDDETAEWVMLQVVKFFRNRPEPLSVCDKRLGVIGVGAVGKQVIKLAQAFHMQVFYNAQAVHSTLSEQGAQFLSKEDLFKTCDVISCHTPPFLSWLTPSMLAQAKNNLCLLNTCMGKISSSHELEDFLNARTDVTYVMDAVAATFYGDLKSRAPTWQEAAYVTVDSKARLIDKFFAAQQQFLNTSPRSA